MTGRSKRSTIAKRKEIIIVVGFLRDVVDFPVMEIYVHRNEREPGSMLKSL